MMFQIVQALLVVAGLIGVAIGALSVAAWWLFAVALPWDAVAFPAALLGLAAMALAGLMELAGVGAGRFSA